MPLQPPYSQAASPAIESSQDEINASEPSKQAFQREDHTRLDNRTNSSPSPSLKRVRPEIGQESHPSRPRWRRVLSTIKFILLDQWFLFALSFFILLASQIQVPSSQQEKKETVVTYCCVALIFFITGCTLSTKILVANYSRWKIHVFVQLQSFLLTSAIVYAVVSLCATNPDFMDPGLLVGLVFMGCVPTTISSNVTMTKQANGNQALTVVQSTLGNFLGPFLSPLLILMYTSTGAWYTKVVPGVGPGGFGELYERIFKQLGLSIFLPLVCFVPLKSPVQRWLTSPQGCGPNHAERLPKGNQKGFRRLETLETGLLVAPDHHLANV